jgi:mannose-1-phosphate guanylyltransferase
MAGGAGTKLWPISREAAPKQFYPLIGRKTLFQHNVEALLERHSPADIYVSTTRELIHFIFEQAPQIPVENYFIEPELKDSGPACCYSMIHLFQKFPDETVMFYVQTPITRNPVDKYLDMVETIEELVKSHHKWVTGTQIPRYVETGSDLLRLGKTIATSKGHKAYTVTDFINVVRDQMDLASVQKIATESKVGTHSNHHTWTPRLFLEAVQEIRPDWYELTKQIEQALSLPNKNESIEKIYHNFEPGRIELVSEILMRKGDVIAVEMPYKWTHITTWDDVYRYYREEQIPTHQTEVIEIESKNNLVFSDTKKLVALIGLDDIAVIETPDTILITPRKKANKVKQVHDTLKTLGRDEYL